MVLSPTPIADFVVLVGCFKGPFGGLQIPGLLIGTTPLLARLGTRLAPKAGKPGQVRARSGTTRWEKWRTCRESNPEPSDP